uniref:Uncharacterized protein n=1 Tax=Oryza punctata TaxID=4537 RepID=A0A0E0M603_ORYPU
MAPKSAALLAIVITMSLLSVEVANGCGNTSCSNTSPPWSVAHCFKGSLTLMQRFAYALALSLRSTSHEDSLAF